MYIYHYRGGVAHVFACPLRVLDAGLAGARHAVGHAPRVAARVTMYTCTQCNDDLPARVRDLPQVRLICPELVIVCPDQGLVTRPGDTCHVCLHLTCPHLTGPSADSRSEQSDV